MPNLTSKASVAILSAALSTPFANAQTTGSEAPNLVESNFVFLRTKSAEWESICTATEAKQKEWSSLPTEADIRLRKCADNLALNGMRKLWSQVEYTPGGYALTTITFRPTESQHGLNPSFLLDTEEQIKAGLKELTALKNDGYFKDSFAHWGLLDSGDFQVGIISKPGDKAGTVPALEKLSSDLSTHDSRAQVWAENLAILALGEIAASSQDVNIATTSIENLRSFYESTGDTLSARLAQAILTKNAKSVDPLIRYVSMGVLTAEEMLVVPEFLRGRVEHANFLTRNMPRDTQRQVMRERVAAIELPAGIAGLIDLEEQAGLVTATIADAARVEAKNAIHYAKEKITENVKPTVADAISIVRDYFEEAYPSDYRFRDSIHGLATGLAIRRTDCSTRAILAMEMLKAMGCEAGAEIISPQKDGKDISGQPGHMYNYVFGLEDVKIYVDYCTPKSKKYIFPDNREIIDQYVGDSGLNVKILVHSSDASIVYGMLVNEPVVELIQDFGNAFRTANDDLPTFLQKTPSWHPTVELLWKFSKAKDEIFGTSEVRLWEEGTQAAIRELYNLGD